MGWRLPQHRVRRAERFEDLATALDAGLGIDALGLAGLPAGRRDDGLAARIGDAVGDLGAIDAAVLGAAESAGALPAALRDLAAAERAASEQGLALLGRLAYPALVASLAFAVSALLATLGLAALPPGLLALWLAVPAAALITWILARRRARRDPAFDLGRVPVFGALAADTAMVPYLDAMARLHGAGLRLDEAHRLATATCPLARSRARLTAAGTSLASGARYAEALAKADALDAGARDALAQAERIGGLEETFRTLAQRRRAAILIRSRRLVRLIGGLAYAMAVVLVLALVVSFYGGMLARLGAGGR
jgi:type II secretory pathway component PulF